MSQLITKIINFCLPIVPAIKAAKGIRAPKLSRFENINHIKLFCEFSTEHLKAEQERKAQFDARAQTILQANSAVMAILFAIAALAKELINIYSAVSFVLGVIYLVMSSIATVLALYPRAFYQISVTDVCKFQNENTESAYTLQLAKLRLENLEKNYGAIIIKSNYVYVALRCLGYSIFMYGLSALILTCSFFISGNSLDKSDKINTQPSFEVNYLVNYCINHNVASKKKYCIRSLKIQLKIFFVINC